jgi:hypothetical protein
MFALPTAIYTHGPGLRHVYLYSNILIMVAYILFVGHLWNEVNLSGIVASTAWKLISVSALHLEWGKIFDCRNFFCQ